MEKISKPNNFSHTFQNIISTEQIVTAIGPLHITYEDISLMLPDSDDRASTGIGIPMEKTWNFVIKRGFDILLSVILIVIILSWLIPLLAILIKLDSPGSVFFWQKRNKNDGRIFTCLKFRTMIVNEDADILPVCENDKRITLIGKFLRRFHIDELPQLFNVLAGDMSIIGPRPHMICENILYANLLQNYDYRHTVKPGITGLAQSMGNFGATHDLEKIKERVRLDTLYINKWSLGMDIKILCRTSLIILGFIGLNK